MRVNTGRRWQDLGPRRGEALMTPSLQFRDGEVVGSIDPTIIAAAGPVRGLSVIGQRRRRTAGVDRPSLHMVR